MKKFEVLSVEEEPGGSGPERVWKIHYKAYVKKQWVQDTLLIIARNATQACEQAKTRFG